MNQDVPLRQFLKGWLQHPLELLPNVVFTVGAGLASWCDLNSSTGQPSPKGPGLNTQMQLSQKS